MAPPMQFIADQRDTPSLTEQYGRRWNGLLEQRGYFYVGSTDRPGTLRVPSWRPKRVVAVDPRGLPSVWVNACRHHGYRLIPPAQDLAYHLWNEKIECKWHAMRYGPTGEVKSPGLVHLQINELPERRCPKREILTWRGLIFELGQKTEEAREELRASLDFVEKAAGEIFDFRDYKLQKSVRAPQRLPEGDTADAHTSIDNYLDVTHVPRHPENLASLVSLRSAEYSFLPQDTPPERAVVQFMKPRDTWTMTALGYQFYRCGIPKPAYGAVWVTTRMGLMLEYYPGVIVVSQCFPHPERWWECAFYHDFYYHRLASRDFIACHQELFEETGQEDLEWCSSATRHIRDRIEEGRGSIPWGFFDRRAENFGRWYSASARTFLGLE